jgi:hypothetical protein
MVLVFSITSGWSNDKKKDEFWQLTYTAWVLVDVTKGVDQQKDGGTGNRDGGGVRWRKSGGNQKFSFPPFSPSNQAIFLLSVWLGWKKSRGYDEDGGGQGE